MASVCSVIPTEARCRKPKSTGNCGLLVSGKTQRGPLNTLDGKESAKIENIGRTLDEIIQEADNSIIGKKEDSQKIVPENVTRQEVTTLSYDIFKATKADSKERKELTDIYTEYAGSLDITKVKDEDLNVLYGKLQDLFKKI